MIHRMTEEEGLKALADWCEEHTAPANPFDAATAALIECFEANEAYYQTGQCLPNYPMPAIPYQVAYTMPLGISIVVPDIDGNYQEVVIY